MVVGVFHSIFGGLGSCRWRWRHAAFAVSSRANIQERACMFEDHHGHTKNERHRPPYIQTDKGIAFDQDGPNVVMKRGASNVGHTGGKR